MWQDLQLSHNQLKVLADVSFTDFPELHTLNVSLNALVNVERDTFRNLTQLKCLDLSGNELQGVVINLPENMEEVRMGNNSLRLWPLTETPKKLTHLDMHGNELNEVFVGQETVGNLKVNFFKKNFEFKLKVTIFFLALKQILNVSRNVIESFPYTNFTHLSILDLSYNSFTEVPKHLPKYAPLLEQLIMDNNPLSSLKLEERMRLSKLSFKNMPFIESIDAFTFSNVGTCYTHIFFPLTSILHPLCQSKK